MDINHLKKKRRVHYFQRVLSNLLKLFFVIYSDEERVGSLETVYSAKCAKKELLMLIKDFSEKLNGVSRNEERFRDSYAQ